jgi:uncharacterized protein with NAD-binding domain and iron-sulfur cluster
MGNIKSLFLNYNNQQSFIDFNSYTPNFNEFIEKIKNYNNNYDKKDEYIKKINSIKNDWEKSWEKYDINYFNSNTNENIISLIKTRKNLSYSNSVNLSKLYNEFIDIKEVIKEDIAKYKN